MQLSKHLRLQTGLDKFSPAVAQQLVEALYVRDLVVPMGACGQVMAAAVIEIRTGAWWLVVWAALAIVVSVARMSLIRAYWRSTPACHGVPVRDRWVFRFLLGAWINGAMWGMACAALLSESDPFGPFLLIICNTAYVTGASVRLSPVPIVAKGHTLLNIVPVAVAALATAKPYYMLLDIFAFLHLFAVRGLAVNVHRTILKALLASEENAQLAADLADSNRKLEELVTTDALTGLVNRRGFDIRLLQECAQAKRCERPLSLLLLDIDHFKQFNDLYGHQTGDDCLRRVALAIRSAIRRPFDIAARYGGEELAVILPATEEAGSERVGEQVRAAVAALMIPHAGSGCGHVTVSVGAVTQPSHEAPSPASLVHLADHALYAAKRGGRNQVATYTPPAGPAARAGGAHACSLRAVTLPP